MSNKYGVFINLDYAHKSQEKCSLIWNKIMDLMLEHNFSFEKRAFVIFTENNCDEISMKVRDLLDEIEIEQADLYSYLSDCYVLNFENCTDLTLPGTSNINVEHISLDDLDAIGVKYGLLFENDK